MAQDKYPSHPPSLAINYELTNVYMDGQIRRISLACSVDVGSVQTQPKTDRFVIHDAYDSKYLEHIHKGQSATDKKKPK